MIAPGRSGARRDPANVLYGLLLGLVLLIALLPYYEVLWYHFTDADTMPVIYSARVESWDDLRRILTVPLKSRIWSESAFFRPTMTLSFTLDEAVWGLEPFGYHLTNLLLHLAAAGLLFHLVYRINGRDYGAAAVAGGFYSLHPILTEVVPVTIRRQETLVAVFLLLGLLAFRRYEYGAGSRLALTGALLCFVAAAGAKEVGMMFLPVVVAHLWLWNPEGRTDPLYDRWTSTLRRSLPYLTAGFLYLLWWGWVTRIRAFVGTDILWRNPLLRRTPGRSLYNLLVDNTTRTVPFYFRSLTVPFLEFSEGSIGTVASLINTLSRKVPTGIGPTLVALVVLVLIAAWTRRNAPPNPPGSRVLRLGSTLGVGLLFAWPLYEPFLNEVVRIAYEGRGLGWLTAAMESRDALPLSRYQERMRELLRAGLIGLSALLAAGWALLNRSRLTEISARIKNGLDRRLRTKQLGFYALWFLTPALILGLTQVKGWNNSYVGILPWSALIATTATDLSRRLIPRLRKGFRPGSRLGTPSLSTGVEAAGLVAILLYVLSFVMISPHVKRYPGWRFIQQVDGRYTQLLERTLKSLPPHSRVVLKRIPFMPARLTGTFPHVSFYNTTISYRWWAQTRFPDKALSVSHDSYRPVVTVPSDFPLPATHERVRRLMRTQGRGNLRLEIESKPLASHYYELTATFQADAASAP